MKTTHHAARINLKLRELSQLFNSMDPSPFLDRDLDHDAEEFIVSWARELPRSHGFELVIHLANLTEPEKAVDVESAVRHYFATRAGMKQRDFRQLLRRGHASLSIGLVFLAACLLASGFATKMSPAAASGIVREGFIIVGWVAMWRPLEIYLYDWWPVRDEWRILQALSRMHVRVVPPHAAADAARNPDPPPQPQP